MPLTFTAELEGTPVSIQKIGSQGRDSKRGAPLLPSSEERYRQPRLVQPVSICVVVNSYMSDSADRG